MKKHSRFIALAAVSGLVLAIGSTATAGAAKAPVSPFDTRVKVWVADGNLHVADFNETEDAASGEIRAGNNLAIVIGSGGTVKTVVNPDAPSDPLVVINAGTGCSRVRRNTTKCKFTGKVLADLGDNNDFADITAPNGAIVHAGDDYSADVVTVRSDAPVEIYGGDGGDILRVIGNGRAYIDGGDDFDTVIGGAGNDILHGGESSDTVEGGSGDDQVFGDEGGLDYLSGGPGNDILDTNAAGGGGVMFGGTGGDIFRGGPGVDEVSYADYQDGEFPELINSPAATCPVTVSFDNVANDGCPQDDTRDPSGGRDNVMDSIDSITGGPLDDVLNSNPKTKSAQPVNNWHGTTLNGGGGNDTLNSAGNTVLTGGVGKDQINAKNNVKDWITPETGNKISQDRRGDEITSNPPRAH